MFNPFGTVNIGSTIIIDATGGVGTYTVAADCTGSGQSPTAQLSTYTSGPVHSRFGLLETSPLVLPASE